ncbi:DUF4129 domain-containing protein [Actinopolymorpha sp. B17G11]|uniref:DUF4129 domain-containing protein n=1 Tax=Actinopolymorpha sp. B17G11 TaxID=3160861 RepID=UPI0032E4B7E7
MRKGSRFRALADLRTSAQTNPAARVGVVAAVVALLALGALGLDGRERITLDDRQLSTRGLVMLFAAVLVAGLVLIVVALATQSGGPPRGVEPKRTSLVARVVQLLVLVGLLYLLLRHADELKDLFNQRGEPDAGGRPPGAPGGEGAADPGADGAGRPPSWSWPVVAMAGLLLAAVVGTLTWVARLSGLESTQVGDGDPTADEVQHMVAAGLAALADVDEPRAAVIGAYAAMEEALAHQGVARGATDTPSDLLARTIRAGLLTSTGEAAARELAGLFERARFSRRALPADARLAAVAALNRLQAELRAQADRRAQAELRARAERHARDDAAAHEDRARS